MTTTTNETTRKPLGRIFSSELYWFDESGRKHDGNCSGLRGNCSDLRGDCSGIPNDSRPCSLSGWVEEQ